MVFDLNRPGASKSRWIMRGIAAVALAGAAIVPLNVSSAQALSTARTGSVAAAAVCEPNTIWTFDDGYGNRTLWEWKVLPDGSIDPTPLKSVKTTLAFGDIALGADGTMYGINFEWQTAAAEDTRLYKIDLETGTPTPVHINSLAVGMGNQFNSLTAMPDGTLLTGQRDGRNIFKIDPATGDVKLWGQYPEGMYSAGDFRAMPDGSVVGIANGTGGTLIRWNADGTNPVVIGANLGGRAWGMASSNGYLYIVYEVGGMGPGAYRVDLTQEQLMNAGPSTALPPITKYFMNGVSWGATSAEESTNCTQQAALTIDKSGSSDDTNGNGRVDVGEPLNYSFLVTNTGNVPLENVSVSDPMFPNAGDITSVDSGVLGLAGTRVFTASRPATEADIVAGSVSNTATASGDQPQPPNSDVVLPPVVSTPDTTVIQTPRDPKLDMVKSASLVDGDGDGQADVGEKIDYTFTVTNTGNVTVSDVTVDDQKLADAGIVPVLAPGAPGTLAPGASTTFVAPGYVVTGADVVSGSVKNTATAGGTPPANADGSVPPALVSPPSTAVVAVDPAPSPGDQSILGGQGEPIVFDPVSVSTPGADTDPLDPTSVKLVGEGELSADGKTLTVPGEGVWVVDPVTGVTTFTPVPGFEGDPTPVEFTVADSNGTVSVTNGTLTPTYPDISDLSGTGDQGEPVTVLLTGDKRVDVSTVVFPEGGQPIGSTVTGDGKSLTVPGEGVWVVNPDGSVTFTPEVGFEGDPTPVTYTAKSTDGTSVTPAVITVKVPDVSDVSGSGEVGKSVTVPTDVDGDVVPGSVLLVGPGSDVPSKTVTVPGEGVWTVNEDDSVTFTPLVGFTGDPTPIKYVGTDVDGNVSVPADITIKVTAPPLDTVVTPTPIATVTVTATPPVTPPATPVATPSVSMTVPVTVPAATPATALEASMPATLAQTGTEAVGYLTAAGSLVTAGVALLLAARSRKSTPR